jgi:hypothetical protein
MHANKSPASELAMLVTLLRHSGLSCGAGAAKLCIKRLYILAMLICFLLYARQNLGAGFASPSLFEPLRCALIFLHLDSEFLLENAYPVAVAGVLLSHTNLQPCIMRRAVAGRLVLCSSYDWRWVRRFRLLRRTRNIPTMDDLDPLRIKVTWRRNGAPLRDYGQQ